MASSLIGAIALAALLQAPQQPSEARKKLVQGLEDKLVAMGPISFEVTGEHFDEKGARSLELSGRFHVNLADSLLYFSITKTEASGEASVLHTFVELGDFGLIWSKDAETTFAIFGNWTRRTFKKDYAIRSKVNAFFGKPPEYKDVQAAMAALRNMLHLDVAVKPEDRESADVVIRLETSDGARASWLKEALGAPEDAIRRRDGDIEMVTVTPRKTVLIDPTTGFVKSIQVELPNGTRKLLKVVGLARADVRPDIRFPVKTDAKPTNSGEDLARRHARGIIDTLPAFRDRLVKEWTVVGTKEKADSLSDLLALVAVDCESSFREAVHRKLAAEVVKKLLERGNSLADLSGGVQDAAVGLKKVIEKSESRERDEIDKVSDSVRVKLGDVFREAPKDMAETLAVRLKEAFDPARLAKVRAAHAPPDAVTLLREEIADAVELASAPDRLAMRIREWQARRLSELVAQAGPFSCKITVESSEDDPAKPRLVTEFHWRPEEGCAHAAMYEAIKEGRRTRIGGAEYRVDGKIRAWVGDKGWQLDFAPAVDSVWRLAWDREVEFSRLMEQSPVWASKEAYVASFKPVLLMRLVAGRPGSNFSSISTGALLHPEGKSSWIGDFLDAESVEFFDAGTAKFGSGRQSTLIDLKSGFPIWFRNDFGNGRFKIMRVSDLKLRAPKPELPPRPALRESTMPPEFKAVEAGNWLWETMKKDIPRILREWERLGSPDRADAVRRFFSRAAAWSHACYGDKVRMHHAIEFVQSAVSSGRSLDELAGDSEALTAQLAQKLTQVEADSADKFQGNDQRFMEALRNLISDEDAPYESRRSLAKLAAEACEPERLKASKPERPPPDFKMLLRASIDDARRKAEE